MEVAPKSSYRPSLHLLSHYYSVKSTLRCSPGRKLVVSSPRQSVFERLYVRRSQSPREFSTPRLSERQSARRASGAPPVEEKLLFKAKEASEHLTSLRTQYLAEELHELRPAPAINALSRKIVERLDRERYGVAPAPVVVQTRLPPKEEPREAPKPRTQQLAAPQAKTTPPRSLTRSEMNMLRAMMLHGKLSAAPKTQLGIPPPPERRTSETEEAAKLATLQSLRSEAMSRFQSEEPELPPDFFSLSFDARSRLFSESRIRKLQQAKQREQVREAQECTFQPIFYARIPHRRLNNSTSELLHISRERSPVARTASLTQRIRRSPGYYERYQQRLTDTLRQSAR